MSNTGSWVSRTPWSPPKHFFKGDSFMVKKTLKSNIINLVKKYATLAKSKYVIDQVIVFGSQAKGNSNEWSDIDVCLVSSQFGKDFFKEKSLLRYLTIPISTKIEPTPMNPIALQSKYNTLAHEIRTHGIVIKI
jgi:predicted nucleotidyltransferase